MATSIGSRIRSAWNTFRNEEQTDYMHPLQQGPTFSTRPDRPRMGMSNERSIIAPIYTRIGLDVASVDIRHIQLDEARRYLNDRVSGIQDCLAVEGNIDQSAFMLKLDLITSLFDKGVVALVPVDTSSDPTVSGSYDVLTMRVGEIVQWYPYHVRVRLYNQDLGIHQEVTVEKASTAIIENPLYAVMNEPNSTLQRLIRKLNLLDAVDEQSGSGKLDLIIQLPYVVKSEARKQQADQRRMELERQMSGSKYGVAWADGTEKITQLNRPTENNLFKQVEYLTEQLYSSLGLTQAIFDGTADEKEMLNYHNRTIAPLLTAIVQEMKRKFLTKTARTQGQSIEFFRDPFKLVSIADLAELGDKLTRNEIVTGNEFRAVIGFTPSKDPKADELRNKNLPMVEPPALPSEPTE